MARRWAAVKEQWRRILDNRLLDDLVTSPASPEDLYIDSHVGRVLAHILGIQGGHAQFIRATPSKALCVYPNTTNFYDTTRATAADAWSSDLWAGWDYIFEHVDIWVWTNDLLVQIKPYKTAPVDDIKIPANSMYSLDLLMEQIFVKNATAGSNADYQVVGWFHYPIDVW